jgi:ribonuclease P protein component
MASQAAQTQPETPKQFFRRRQRLPSSGYALVFDAKLRKSRGPITVHLRANELSGHRLGLSIGRRFGGAISRGRFKRMMREVFRLNQIQLPRADDETGYDVVVTARAHEPANLDEYTKWVLEAIEAAHRVNQRRVGRGDG